MKLRPSKDGVQGKKLEQMVKIMEDEVWQMDTDKTIRVQERKQSMNGVTKPEVGKL